MSSKMEKLEKNEVKLMLTISNERFEEGMKFSYNKNKGKISLPGFRKGKAPRAIIEKQYGKEIFIDDAVNFVFPEAYSKAVAEHNLDPVARPVLEMVDNDPESGVLLEVLVTVKPPVTLGKYKGLTYKDESAEATDEEIQTEINRAREKNARIVEVTDKAVEDGDTVTIDFEGFNDGAPFEGGKDENFDLVIGSKTFIDTFEEQIIGKNIGDNFEVNVTFPENYGNEDLSGKPALFKVALKGISRKELPEVDDEFAKDVSEFDTLNEYKNDIKDKLNERKAQTKIREIEEELIKKACEDAEVDIPEVMVDNQVDQMVQEFSSRAQRQGLDFDTFLQYSGQTIDVFKEGYKEAAANNVKARLVLEAISAAENIEPSSEDIDNEIIRISKTYGIDESKMKGLLSPEDLKGLATDLKTQKALKIIVDNAVAE